MEKIKFNDINFSSLQKLQQLARLAAAQAVVKENN